jgi:hypothetical protein
VVALPFAGCLVYAVLVVVAGILASVFIPNRIANVFGDLIIVLILVIPAAVIQAIIHRRVDR